MKKLLVVFATAIVALSVKAATVTWNVADENGDGFLTPGGVVYLFEGSDASGVPAAITGGTFNPSSALAESTVDEYGEVFVNKIGNYAEGDSTSFYMVAFDSADISSGNFKVSGVEPVTFGKANKTLDFTDSMASATWSPVAVPEPASVALLAIGLAALGLKRKVA